MKYSYLLLLFTYLLLFFVSCGKNVFSNLDSRDDTGVAGINELMDVAQSSDDYVKAIEMCDAIIQSSEFSIEDKQQAYAIKGEAILGKNNLTPLDVFSDLTKLVSEEDDSKKTNIFYALKIDEYISLSDIFPAANSINRANEMGSQDKPLSKVNGNKMIYQLSLSKDQQLIRGIANSLVILKIIQNVFDIDQNGDLSIKNPVLSYYERLEYIVQPPALGNDITHYANNMTNAFMIADVFTENQIENIHKLKYVTDQLKILYDTILYHRIYNGPMNQYDFTSVYDDYVIKEAMDEIFSTIKS